MVRESVAAFLYLCLNLGLAIVPAALHSRQRYVRLLAQTASGIWPALVTLGACAVSISTSS